MKRAIIIDDESLARLNILECLKHWPKIDVVAECTDGFEGVKRINELNPDLIFLDIQMPRINGFEMLELIDNPPAVIFTTAFDEYAFKAFESNAIDYLLKPFNQDRFDKAISKFLSADMQNHTLLETTGKSSDEANRIVVKHNGEIRIIPNKDVLYLEAYDDYVKIHTESTVFVKKQTLAFYENALDKHNFVRIHRSYIANVNHVSALDRASRDKWEVRLRNGFHLAISKPGYMRLKEIMGL